MKKIKSNFAYAVLFSVIFALIRKCNSARIPLQVDITKMVQCDDSKRAGNGDKVSFSIHLNLPLLPIFLTLIMPNCHCILKFLNLGYSTLWRIFDGWHQI